MENSILISTDKSKLDIPMIHNYLSNESYWAKGRSLEAIKTSINHSICFGVYIENQQVGFGRIISDYSVFAWLLDVFILPEHQGKGLGKKLMSYIMNQEDLKKVGSWGLGTKDAHGLYEQYGFTISKANSRMEKRLDHA